MNEGMLWYDDDPKRALPEKVSRAAKRYRQKYGSAPNVCYVHPLVLENNGEVKKVGQVRVASLPSVLRHHFWLGQEEHGRRRKARSSEN